MKQSHKIVSILVGAALISLLFLAIVSCQKEKQEVYNIGAILPLTGGASFLGKPGQNVLKMQEDLINSKGGVQGHKIKIHFTDSKSTPKDGLSAFHKLLAQNTKFYITHLTMVAMTIQPAADKEKVVQMAVSMHPTIASRSKYTFRIYYGIETEIEKIAEYIKQKGGKRIAILYIDTPEMAAGVKEAVPKIFAKYNLNLLAAEPYKFTAKDIRPQFLKIVSTNPDYIIIEDYGTVAINIIREAEKFKLKDKLIGGIGFTGILPDFRKIAEGIPFAVPSPVVQKPETYLNFLDNYKSRFGEEPVSPIDAVYTADALRVLVTAIEKVGYEPEKVAKAVSELTPYNGVIGQINITPEGNAIFTASMATFRNGKVVSY